MAERFDALRFTEISSAILGDLRSRFQAAGFNEQLLERAEAIAPGQIDRVRLPMVDRSLTRRGDPGSTLARLFTYSSKVPAGAIRACLGERVADALLDVQILEEQPEGLRSRLTVMPFYGLWIFGERLDEPEPVMGPGATTTILARALPPQGLGSLLDVGTGAGSFALLARSRGVPEVVGVDIDPRALAFAELNSRLNDLKVEWRQGDLTEPINPRRFEALVAQPPFVTRPEGMEQTTFLHGGRRGDELTMRLLGQLDRSLSSRGRAWILFDAPIEPQRGIRDRLRAALGAGAFSLIAIAGPGHTADGLALAYASLADPTLGTDYDRIARQYRDHLEAILVEETKTVLLHVERTPHPYSVVLEPKNLGGWDAAGLDRLRKAMELVGLPDDALYATRIRVAPEAWLIQEGSLASTEAQRLRVHFERGRGIEQTLTDTAALLVTCVRDHPTLDGAATGYAEALGGTIAEVRPELLAFVRQGLVLGLFEAGL